MIPLSLEKIAELTEGKLHNCLADQVVRENFFFDSRRAISGGIFIAIKGDRVDGHDYVSSALAQGAVAVLSERVIAGPCIVVSDVLIALGKIANYVRHAIPNLKVIGITGSQGKTTSKDLLHQILSGTGKTHAARGSYNNDLGAPLTLLECDQDVKFCIVEMGARHAGDIARLTKIADPDIGVVLRIGSAHIGEFGSIEKIASAKRELIDFLPPNATAVLGTYDEITPTMTNLSDRKTIRFGEGATADVRAADIEFREGRPHFDLVTPAGREAVTLQLAGVHQISNALASAAVATVLNIPIEQIASRLSNATNTSKWRMEMHDLAGLLLINDAYNANPESMAAALRTLALLSQERGGSSWAFLGTMQELGGESARLHQEVGKLAEDLGIDHLVAVGNFEYCRNVGDEITVHKVQSVDGAAELFQYFQPGDVVLIKASRSEQFERIADSALIYWRTSHISQLGESEERSQ